MDVEEKVSTILVDVSLFENVFYLGFMIHDEYVWSGVPCFFGYF